MSASNLHLAWARLFMRALADSGVTDVVLSPGSRSTPLALALAAEPLLRLHVVLDERAAAFFALGQARITGRPSVLVCTSGTAGAHYLPAVLEAASSFVPMIAVTADRPWELQDAAAPQTIDQLKLFGGHVRHFAELGLPDASPVALRAVQRIAAQAVARALAPTPGPVHVNARFRKPLEPVDASGPEAWESEVEGLLGHGPPRVFAPSAVADPGLARELAERVSRASRGLVVCGPSIGADHGALRAAAVALARRTGFPLLAEATSQARFGGVAPGVTSAGAFDALLRSASFRGRSAPDLILELGAPPTSSGYARYVEEHRGATRVLVAPHGWNDPAGGAGALLSAGPADVLAAVDLVPAGESSAWSRGWADADARAWGIVEDELAGEPSSEALVARLVAAGAPEGSVLAIGNSSPVRELDTWAPPSMRALSVVHQRGVSGIDGLVSGAAGARSVTRAPVTLVLGDVSLLHDLGGLELARRAEGPLAIVVVNNDGGRIFEQLPLASRPECEDALARCFTTPHGLSFEAFARGFGVRYAAPRARTELCAALDAAWSTTAATLIEVKVPPRDAAARNARLWGRVDRALAG